MLDIVTVHLNDFDGLEHTRRSLERLPGNSTCNWLVIDGASQPESPEHQALLELTRQQCNQFRSEPDAGIFDAMNKGTALCRGDYVLYLNAGDCMHPDFSLPHLESELGAERPAMIWGTCYEQFPNGVVVKVKNRSPALAWYGTPVNHQNVLFRRDVLGSNPYDKRFRYCADYDLISRILNAGQGVHRSQMPIAIFQRGGVSAQNFEQTMREEENLRSTHFGVPPALSKAISALKKFNQKAGAIPSVRRLMRKWV